ncbi:MAG: FkbM family methyltransferase [Terracidiphilus sp.]
MKPSARFLVRLIVRRYPIYSGVMRLVNSRLLKFLTSEHETVVTTLRSGPKIFIDVNDYCARPIYYWGDYDPRITELCINTLRPGDVMLDIGANYGEIALAAAARVGPTGAVHAFEPNATAAACLRRSAEINGLRNVYVHEVALGAFDGMGELMGPVGNSGAGSLMPSDIVAVGAGLTDRQRVSLGTVQVRAAGKYLQSLNLPSLAVVKVDVEGMEAVVIESIRECLAKYHPRLIAFESHEASKPFFERAAVKVLAELGYEFAQVDIRRNAYAHARAVPVFSDADIGPGYDFIATTA